MIAYLKIHIIFHKILKNMINFLINYQFIEKYQIINLILTK